MTVRRDAGDSPPILFGPVPSRRLGLSLGVDLVPHKVCTLDCVYCEVGRTTEHTLERRSWVPKQQVLDELATWFKEDGDANHLTFSGSGEPTLSSDIEDVIQFIKDNTAIPLALLTNGTLLSDKEVRREILGVNLISPSLDAADPETFTKINRPVAGLDVAAMVDGLVALRQEFQGKYWLEVLLVGGINDHPESLEALAAAITRIQPDRVQLNTVVRPGTETWAEPASTEVLEQAISLLGANTEVIATFVAPRHKLGTDLGDLGARILGVVSRRPETPDRLAISLGVANTAIKAAVSALVEEGRVRIEQRGTEHFVRTVALR